MNTNLNLKAGDLFQRIGGESALRSFVERLYQYMDQLPEVKKVRDMHGMSLTEAGKRLFRFLSGWLGRPQLYHLSYGEPRLRRRHMHVSIGIKERDQWLLCAQKAMNDMDWPEVERNELMYLLRDMADHLINNGPLDVGCNGGGRVVCMS